MQYREIDKETLLGALLAVLIRLRRFPSSQNFPRRGTTEGGGEGEGDSVCRVERRRRGARSREKETLLTPLRKQLTSRAYSLHRRDCRINYAPGRRRRSLSAISFSVFPAERLRAFLRDSPAVRPFNVHSCN